MKTKKENDTDDESLQSLNQINPFVHKLDWDDPLDKLKTVIFTIILLPFRSICIMVLLTLAWLLAHVGLYGLSREELTQKPLKGWRKKLRDIAAELMRLIFVVGIFHHTNSTGKRVSSKEAPILCTAPHSSFLDAICVIVSGPSSVVAKQDTSSLPFFGKLIDFTQPIYVCREDPDSRQKTIQGIIERAKSKEDWPQILIFPEGTTTNRTSLIQFKPGAFYPGEPIQPVLVRYPNKVDTVTWTWEGPEVIMLLWRTITQFHTICEIEYLPVYVPNEEEKVNPKLYASNVQHLMAKALNIPTSDYSFDDCKLMNFAKNLCLPHVTDMSDIHKMRQKLGLTETDFEVKVAASRTFEPDNSYVTLAEFAQLLQLDVNPYTTTLFNLFKNQTCPKTSETIDFREYLLCSLFLITLGSQKINFIKSLFQLNSNKTGQVSREQFHHCVKYSLTKLTGEKIDSLFVSIDENSSGFITFDQFHTYTKKRKEFSRLFSPSDQKQLKH